MELDELMESLNKLDVEPEALLKSVFQEGEEQ